MPRMFNVNAEILDDNIAFVESLLERMRAIRLSLGDRTICTMYENPLVTCLTQATGWASGCENALLECEIEEKYGVTRSTRQREAVRRSRSIDRTVTLGKRGRPRKNKGGTE